MSLIAATSTTTTAVSSTTLPKVTLSYKWVINDAKIFLTHQSKLRSQPFSLLLPFRISGRNHVSSWHLLLQTQSITYEGNRWDLSPQKVTSMYFEISLCQGNKDVSKYEPKESSSARVLISDCVFSLLNPETSEVVYSGKVCQYPHWLEINKSLKTCCTSSSNLLPYDKVFDEYIIDGTLTIHVNATLLCCANPIETLDMVTVSDEMIHVPPDQIRDKMHNLYKAGSLTDVTIQCGDKEFKVHRAILASQSTVFKRMFEVDMKEKQSSIVNISDVPPAVVSDLIAYFYTGTAPNVRTLAKELLNTANKYELPRLFAICEKELEMKMEVANVVDTLILADLHSPAYLKKACLNFIHLNLAEVQKTNEWKSLKVNLDHYGALLIEALEYRPR